MLCVKLSSGFGCCCFVGFFFYYLITNTWGLQSFPYLWSWSARMEKLQAPGLALQQERKTCQSTWNAETATETFAFPSRHPGPLWGLNFLLNLAWSHWSQYQKLSDQDISGGNDVCPVEVWALSPGRLLSCSTVGSWEYSVDPETSWDSSEDVKNLLSSACSLTGPELHPQGRRMVKPPKTLWSFIFWVVFFGVRLALTFSMGGSYQWKFPFPV